MTREEWLEKSIQLITERIFIPKGYVVPKVKISIGFTGSRNSKKALGACWSPDASDDGLCQIFITPTQSDSTDIQAVLVHELVHAVVGNDKGHGKVFKHCALDVGLTGKMRSTVAGDTLRECLNALTNEIGPIPHAKLNLNLNPKKKQGTRLLKVACELTGYTARVTRMWIESYGVPVCPCCQNSMSIEGRTE